MSNTNTQPRASPTGYDAYVSPLLLRRLCDSDDLEKGKCELSSGAAALIDVEGFSTVAERMSRRGAEGIEELAGLINRSFALIVQSVERYGGLAHSFPGDSVIAFWEAHERSLTEATRLAASCARELLDQHGDTQVPLKAGLGAGSVLTARIGGVDGRWQFLLAGDALAQMGQAETRAKRGRLVVSPEAWPHLVPHAVAAAGDEGYYTIKTLRGAPEPGRVSAAANATASVALGSTLRAYLPDVLLRQLDAGHQHWVGEFRDVSVVFVQLGSLPSAARDVETVERGYREVQTAIYAHGGNITRFAQDDKGLAVLAVMGLPPGSTEGSAARAVRAGLELFNRAAAAGLSCRVGIATGRVFCGMIGAPGRWEYTVVGSTTNLAARLMQSAEAGVLCDADTAANAGDACEFARAGRVLPKGLQESLEVFKACHGHAEAQSKASTLLGPRARAGAGAGMVGRTREREALRTWLDELREGRGSVLVIRGEAGVGKSRLVRDLIEQAHAASLELAVTACDPALSSQAYAPWSQLIASLLRLDSMASPEDRATRLVDSLRAAHANAQLAGLVAPLLGLDVAQSDAARRLSGGTRSDNLLAILYKLVAHAASRHRALDRPVLLVIEDVHWLDAASWSLIELLARRVKDQGIGIVLTIRSEVEPSGPRGISVVDAPDTACIDLTPLSPGRTRELAAACLSTGDVDRKLAELVYERSQGNPFFCKELVHELLAEEMIRIEADRAELRSRSSVAGATVVPRSVSDVVTSRLDRLSVPAGLTIMSASVIGSHFDGELLAAVHPAGHVDTVLVTHLSEAIGLHIIHEDCDIPGGYAFNHAITRDVAYEQLPPARRKDIHRAIATYLEGRPDFPARQATLFHHWRRSGDVEHALHHVDEAGTQAMRDGHYHAAAELYGYALEATATQPHEEEPTTAADATAELGKRRAVWAGKLGEAQVVVGMHAAARANLELALRSLGERPPQGAVSLSLAVAREAVIQAGHRVAPALVEGRRRNQQEKLALAAHLYEQLGYVYYSSCEMPRGVHAALRILNRSELAGMSDVMARSYAVMSLATSVVGRRRVAAAYDRRAMRAAREQSDPLTQAYVSWVTALRACGEAQWDLASIRARLAHEVCETMGERRLALMSLQTLAWPHQVRGEFSRAKEIAEAQRAIVADTNNPLWEAWALNGMSEAQLRMGDHDSVVANAERVLAILATEPDRAEEIRATGLLAAALLAGSRTEDALSVARRGLELAGRLRLTNFATFEGFAGICDVNLAFAERAKLHGGPVPATLATAAARSCALLTRYSKAFPMGRPRAYTTSARHAALVGNTRRARRLLDRAMLAADELGMPHEKGLALLTAARSEVLDDQTRLMRATEATRVLGPSQAWHEAAELEKQLNRSGRDAWASRP